MKFAIKTGAPVVAFKLSDAYSKLGMQDLADKSARVLALNFVNST